MVMRSERKGQRFAALCRCYSRLFIRHSLNCNVMYQAHLKKAMFESQRFNDKNLYYSYQEIIRLMLLMYLKLFYLKNLHRLYCVLCLCA